MIDFIEYDGYHFNSVISTVEQNGIYRATLENPGTKHIYTGTKQLDLNEVTSIPLDVAILFSDKTVRFADMYLRMWNVGPGDSNYGIGVPPQTDLVDVTVVLK